MTPAAMVPGAVSGAAGGHARWPEEIQRSGAWPQLWRVVGEYAKISVFDVADGDELHTLLSSLPLFPFMRIHVTPLAQHPSKLRP